MRTLDRSKSFGQVFGDASHAYEQDGRKFDHEGKEVDAPEDKGALTGGAGGTGSDKTDTEVNLLEELLALGQDKVIAQLATVKRGDLVKLLALESDEDNGKKRKKLITALEAEIKDRPADDADELQNQMQ